MTNFYADMALILGLRLRSHVESDETVAAAGAAVIEGLGLRQLLTPDVVNRPLPLEEAGGPQEWHLAARAFLGIFDELVEPVDDSEYSFPKALATYLKRFGEREAATTAAES